MSVRLTPQVAAHGLAHPTREAVDQTGWVTLGPKRLRRHAAAWLAASWAAVPLRWRLTASAAVGLLAAAGVGYATAQNPDAAPLHFAVVARVLIILVLIGTGIYAQTSRVQARMGTLLVGTGLYVSLWLLDGSSNQVLFSIALIATAFAPAVLCFLLLAHPTGHLRSGAERRFMTGAVMLVSGVWFLGLLVARQPPVKGPLLRCSPHCPANVFSVGSAAVPPEALRASICLSVIALFVGTAVLVSRREHASPLSLRRSIAPVWLLSLAIAVTGTLYWGALALGLGLTPKLGAPFLTISLTFPLVILFGLTAERLFLAQALADLMTKLADQPDADPEVLMSRALDDPSLRIAYRRPGRDDYVDAAGRPVPEPDADMAVTLVERGDRPIAAVSYNPELHEQEQYVHAAAAAAMLRLENAQVEAELEAATTELAASRGRVLEMAHAERRRLERDLHDGVQQQLVGLRIKLDLATEMLEQDRTEGERALAAVGEEMDQALQSLRALGRGIYPSLLRDAGLREALKSAARSSPVPARVNARRIDRYPEDIEVAVYFCCLEALQNVAKHAGRESEATIVLWQDGSQMCFAVRDTGAGFDMDTAPLGNGLTNMRDRIQAIGGSLTITSQNGQGTTVAGSVPVPS